ncbi:MAG: GNAT family N-acetyltransferase [Nitrospirae bacterium]|nr:GNAT family N-acetyltransferase [Nitrospirota bacterium]
MHFKRAETEEELYDVYRLRYKIYCLERGYESLTDHPYGMESDEYDPYSVHIIGYVDGTASATARLILPNPIGYPAEKHSNIDIRDICTDTHKIAEISRFAVSCDEHRDSRCMHQATLGMIQELSRIIYQFDIRYILSIMTCGLNRLLSRSGLSFKQIGAPVEYHGIRIPFYAAVGEMTEVLLDKRDSPDLLDLSALRTDAKAPAAQESRVAALLS